jgi:hypothetical protein
MLLFYSKLITNLTTVYDNIIIIIPAQADSIPSLSTFFASSVPASLVINLNHIHTNNTKRNTIIPNQRYSFTNWIYQVIRSDCDFTCVDTTAISLFPSADGKVNLIALTDVEKNKKNI